MKKPSRIVLWLYKIASDKETVENAVGDLTEEYNLNVKTKGRFFAWLVCWRQVIVALLSNFIYSLNWSFVMVKNYLKIALRNIKRHKGFSFINICGLSVGLACTILILLWVRFELSFDNFHKNARNIYRAACTTEKKDFFGSYQTGLLADYLKAEYPEVADATNVVSGSREITIADKKFISPSAFVHPSFFKIFSFSFIKGNKETVFNDLNSMVITEEFAKKLFGDEDPIGKTIGFSNMGDFKITGVIEDIPENSHLQFDFFVPYELIAGQRSDWRNTYMGLRTYVLLQNNFSPEEFNKKIAGIRKQHDPNTSLVLYLQPLREIHLNPLDNGSNRTVMVYVFTTMAVLILLIACINFMNLSTARSENRSREVGIKKTIGSTRGQLVVQFLGESILISFISLLFAVIAVKLILPVINNLLGSSLELNGSLDIILYLIVISLITGLISGSYTAFFLSSFKPAAVLKGTSGVSGIVNVKGFSGVILRKILVVLQFSVTILFVISLFFINKQLGFIKNKDLGYDKENIVVVSMRRDLRRNVDYVKRELLKNPDIISVTYSISKLSEWGESLGVDWPEKRPDDKFDVGLNRVDVDFLDTYNLKLAEGRFFSRDFITNDEDAVVINQSLVKRMGMSEPLGKEITIGKGTSWENKLKIIGILEDFHSESLHKEIRPYMMVLYNTGFFMSVKIKSDNISGSLSYMENTIKKLVPGVHLTYDFLDVELDNLYKIERISEKLITYFTVFAIFISALGLFGLASFMAQKRTKEIGIRKVLGASVLKIVWLLSKEFIILIALANVFAWPIAYYQMNKWLQEFSFKIELSLWVFVIAAVLAYALAFISISYQSIKAANTKPVNTLRYE